MVWFECRHGDVLCRGSMASSLTLRSAPAHTISQDAASNHSHPALLSGGLFAEFVRPDFVVNWIPVMAVQQQQIWRDEFMAVDCTELLRAASLPTFQASVAMYDVRCRGLGQTTSLSVSVVKQWACVRTSWPGQVPAPPLHHSQIFFSVCTLQQATGMPSIGESCFSQHTVSSPPFVQFLP